MDWPADIPFGVSGVVLLPELGADLAVAQTVFNNSNVAGRFGRVKSPVTKRVTQVTINPTVVGVASTVNLALYNEDGTVRLTQVVTANVAVAAPVTTTLTTPILLEAGKRYYLGWCIVAGGGALTLSSFVHQGTFPAPTGKKQLSGTAVIAAGVLPTTIDPIAGLTYANSATLFTRWD